MQRRGLVLGALGAAALAVVIAGRNCARDAPRATSVGPSPAGSGHPEPWSARRGARSAATDAAAPAGEAGAPGKLDFFSAWGSGRDQLGRERPSEGNPMGPMSLAHDGSGRVFVLDQVNGRLVRHGPGGAIEGTSEIKLTAAQDVTVARDGSIAVLDRLVDKAIALYEPSGALRAQLPLDGMGETGLITGVFTDGSDVYVEREHGPLVKVGDVNGTPAGERTEIPGRPSRDGLSFLNAGITDALSGRAWVSSIDRGTGQHRFTRELRQKAQIHSILLLDTDRRGTIYVAFELHEDPALEWVLLQCLDPLRGQPTGSAILPANVLPEESFRDLTVLDDGGVIQALRSADGVSYQRYDCAP